LSEGVIAPKDLPLDPNALNLLMFVPTYPDWASGVNTVTSPFSRTRLFILYFTDSCSGWLEVRSAALLAAARPTPFF